MHIYRFVIKLEIVNNSNEQSRRKCSFYTHTYTLKRIVSRQEKRFIYQLWKNDQINVEEKT